MNCLLIEMGEMACYQERCPQCGRIPPGRKAPGKKSKPPAVFKKLVGRKLSGKKSVKTNGSIDLKTDTVTNQNAKSYVTNQNGKSYVTNQNGKSYITNQDGKSYVTNYDWKSYIPKQTQQFSHNGDKYFPKAVPSRWQIKEDSMV